MCSVLEVLISLLWLVCVLKWFLVLVMGSLVLVVSSLMIFCGKFSGVLMLVFVVVLFSGILVIWGRVDCMCLMFRWI